MSCNSIQESQDNLCLVFHDKRVRVNCVCSFNTRVSLYLVSCTSIGESQRNLYFVFCCYLYLVTWNLQNFWPSSICKLVLIIHRSLFPTSQITDVLVILLKIRHLFWERIETLGSIIVHSLKTRWHVWIPSTIKWLTLYCNKQSQSLY